MSTNITNISTSLKYTDFDVLISDIGGATVALPFPKTNNTINKFYVTPTVYTPGPSIKYKLMTNSEYFYIIRGSYNDTGSANPFTINNISTSAGYIEQIGNGHSGVGNTAWTLFRITSDTIATLTMPQSAYTNGVAIFEFTV